MFKIQKVFPILNKSAFQFSLARYGILRHAIFKHVKIIAPIQRSFLTVKSNQLNQIETDINSKQNRIKNWKRKMGILVDYYQSSTLDLSLLDMCSNFPEELNIMRKNLFVIKYSKLFSESDKNILFDEVEYFMKKFEKNMSYIESKINEIQKKEQKGKLNALNELKNDPIISDMIIHYRNIHKFFEKYILDERYSILLNNNNTSSINTVNGSNNLNSDNKDTMATFNDATSPCNNNDNITTSGITNLNNGNTTKEINNGSSSNTHLIPTIARLLEYFHIIDLRIWKEIINNVLLFPEKYNNAAYLYQCLYILRGFLNKFSFIENQHKECNYHFIFNENELKSILNKNLLVKFFSKFDDHYIKNHWLQKQHSQLDNQQNQLENQNHQLEHQHYQNDNWKVETGESTKNWNKKHDIDYNDEARMMNYDNKDIKDTNNDRMIQGNNAKSISNTNNGGNLNHTYDKNKNFLCLIMCKIGDIIQKYVKISHINNYIHVKYFKNFEETVLTDINNIQPNIVSYIFSTYIVMGINNKQFILRYIDYLNKHKNEIDQNNYLFSIIKAWKYSSEKFDVEFYQMYIKDLLTDYVKNKRDLTRLPSLAYDLLLIRLEDKEIWTMILDILSKDLNYDGLYFFQKKCIHQLFQILKMQKFITLDLKPYNKLMNKLSLFCIGLRNNFDCNRFYDDYQEKYKSLVHIHDNEVIDCCDKHFTQDIVQKFEMAKSKMNSNAKKKYDLRDQSHPRTPQEKIIHISLLTYLPKLFQREVKIMEQYNVCLYKIDLLIQIEDIKPMIALEISGNSYTLENGELISKEKSKMEFLEEKLFVPVQVNTGNTKMQNLLAMNENNPGIQKRIAQLIADLIQQKLLEKNIRIEYTLDSKWKKESSTSGLNMT